MARFFISFDGAKEFEQEVDYPSLNEARNAAIALLGSYLQEKPEFAYQRHWRVDVRDHARRLLTHVIVTTIAAPAFINWDSFEQQSSAGETD